jgi:pimeloyl-ACP methyl ester carboxylesterase
MVTLITRIVLLLQFLAIIALAFAAMKLGRIGSPVAAAAIGFAIVLLVRMLINANNFFVARRYCSETPMQLRLGWSSALRLFLTEFRASMISSSWTMAFHRFHKRVAANPVGLPVLLIHGYGCNSGYWHAMSKAMMHENITHYAVDLEPMLADIDDYVPIVHQAVQSLCRETGHDRIIIVAHSMGGLVVRAFLRVHGTAHIAKVITLGTPHNGTGLANFGIGLNSRQMTWTHGEERGVASDWLRELQKSENDSVRGLFVSIYSHHDNIVSPQTSSHLTGATNIELHGVGHVALAFDHTVQARVIQEIRAASLPFSCSNAANAA